VRSFFFKRLYRKFVRHEERGQSMVEMALAFPILLLVLAGTLEVGKYFNDYLTVLDATREAARYGADGDLILALEPSLACDDNFFHQAACLTMQNLWGLRFDESRDDVVVSVFSIGADGSILARYPRRSGDPRPSFLPDNTDSLVTSNEEGWSYCKHITQPANKSCTPAASRYSNAAITALLAQTHSADSPATGLVLVEMYHVHHQFLGLIPPGMPILPQEVMMYAYTMMPMPSSAPPPGWTP
jgi:hypothetical protein